MPAIEQVLGSLPADGIGAGGRGAAHDDGHLALTGDVEWRRRASDDAPGVTLLDAVRAATLDDGARVWAAGEAAGMQRIRRQLFEERGIDRRRTIIRGYWKTGATGDSDATSD
ncbi:MAG: SIP domain-containing protein [Acidimicrobiia bacterium]